MPKPRRKKTLTTRSAFRGRKQIRIRIPQSPYRPLQLIRRTGVKEGALRPDVPWHTVHRRGIRRIKIGVDPLEARAVSKEYIRGTLPERIVYKYLVSILRLSPSSDFDFQSSLQGGRMELGGMVADFMFYRLKMILQVQGPTHGGFLRQRKDDEQESILKDMGYDVVELKEDLIYSEYLLERRMSRIFNLSRSGGAAQAFMVDNSEPEVDSAQYDTIMNSIVLIQKELSSIQVGLTSIQVALP